MKENAGSSGRVCRRCLLKEMGKWEYLESVQHYRSRLPQKERTPDDVYAARLEACKGCGELVDATCNLCGCYVEMRAARKSIRCPAIPPRWEAIR